MSSPVEAADKNWLLLKPGVEPAQKDGWMLVSMSTVYMACDRGHLVCRHGYACTFWVKL